MAFANRNEMPQVDSSYLLICPRGASGGGEYGLSLEHHHDGLVSINSASGDGATGWARSITEATGLRVARDPFAQPAVPVTSRMNDGGAVFADGMERRRIAFNWGRHQTVGPADRVLRLVPG